VILAEHLKQLDQVLMELKLRDRFDLLEFPSEAAAAMSKHFGERWDSIGTDCLDGSISSEEFLSKRLSLIEEFKSYQYNLQLEKTLVGIFRQQKGA
jgi:hypothetical protein